MDLGSAQKSPPPVDQMSALTPERSRSSLLDVPSIEEAPSRPSNVTHVSFPSYESPLRHHRRKPSTPRHVKETLHARSEYTNSEDDGAAIHRINQYVIKQEVGRGSFGAVHLAVDQYGQEYAVKEFSKSRLRKRAQSSILRRPYAARSPGHLAAGGFNSPLHRRNASDIHKEAEAGNPLYLIREEIAIMKKLNHHNLVSLLEVLDDPSEDSLYMVLEMCKKGVVMKVGMHEPADPYDTERCRTWFRDLILGIEYLHAQGVVHRDIKPDNLLLTDDDVLKIVDFGVSEMFEKNSDLMTAKSAGSPAFLPPELCVSHHGSISGKAADIWSMGVTLYCLYFGRVPFEKTSVLELYEAIRNDEVDVEGSPEESFRDLMRKVLEKDPAKRIKMPELRDHAWVTGDGHDPLLSADENTSDLVEPPTEEEMNRAITGNMSNLLVVMKAVKKFKSLLHKHRPEMLDSILGQETRIVQPPLQMTKSALRAHHHKSQSVDTYDRKPIEQALVREGVHRPIDPDKLEIPIFKRDDAFAEGHGLQKPISPEDHYSEASKSRGPSSPIEVPKPKHASTMNEPKMYGKGQAHDPLDDFLFLSVGLGGSDGPPKEPIVSESPHAADGNIYEEAYHAEVERIRQNSRSATLYLTRRVQNTKKYKGDDNMLGIHERAAATGFARMLDRARGRSRGASESKNAKEEDGGVTTKGDLKRLGAKVFSKMKDKEAKEEEGPGKEGEG